jgi:hypothetical protein
MRIFTGLLLASLFSVSILASGTDCKNGEIGYTKNMDMDVYGYYKGQFMCKEHYLDLNISIFTAVAQAPSYQELETDQDMKSCQPIKRLNKLRWSGYKNYGLPVAVDVHFLNKSKLNWDCEPTEVVGYACSFSFKFKGSSLIFKSKVYDSEINNEFGKCWEILDGMITRT